MPPRYLTRPAMKDHPRERIDKGAEPGWHHTINARLTDDKILATKIKRDNPDKKSAQTVKSTWEHVLRKNTDLPNDWITSREVLVGRRTRHTLPP
ncbi:hypothetical protein BJV78DRAFT_1262268 [Lactifluus subvellereus]|nr:hypothetical protein BJV78DRAFT_1262268 [Lactifluus subvellereus]